MEKMYKVIKTVKIGLMVTGTVILLDKLIERIDDHVDTEEIQGE